ncbi:hypothetical protein SDC9_207337 [bioreactor metagenome]|uniref:Uncharacterized protein n=1 Tax=bioreactor metagenome TaxID=1076179 RepID=A0A645J860_9ZZZZ
MIGSHDEIVGIGRSKLSNQLLQFIQSISTSNEHPFLRVTAVPDLVDDVVIDINYLVVSHIGTELFTLHSKNCLRIKNGSLAFQCFLQNLLPVCLSHS